MGTLLGVGSIRGLENYSRESLPIFSRDVLSRIVRGDPSWEAMVPAPVAQVIRERGLSGWRQQRSAA